MKCPYCAEEISNEALVCRFCQRDIVVFRPIFLRISGIEQSVSDLKRAIDIDPSRTATTTIDRASIAMTSSIALATFTCWITWHYPVFPEFLSRIFDKPLNFLSVASPFFAAIWLGWSAPRLSTRAYLLLGIVPGMIGFVSWFLLHAINVPPYPTNWLSNLFVYAASGPLWFLAGGTIGARIKKRRSRSSAPEGSQVAHGVDHERDSNDILIAVLKGVFGILVASIPYLFKR